MQLSRREFLATVGAGATLAAVGGISPRPAYATHKTFGLLGGSDKDTPQLLAGLKANGFTHRMIPAYWSRLQASAFGPLDAGQLSALRSKISAVRNAGLRVALRINLQYPPGFVTGGSAPVPQFRAQEGTLWSATNSSGDNVRDWVWSRRGRDYAADFIRKVLAALDLTQIDRVELGGGIRGELQFPLVGSYPYKFWCYASHAQLGGTDLAVGAQSATQAGLPKNYVPFGAGSTSVNDDLFRSWYISSLRSMMIWLISEHRKGGWNGPIFVLHPSFGLRSNTTRADRSYQEAVAQGQDWERHVRWYAANDPSVWPWSTWIDRADFVSPPTVNSDLSPAKKLYNVAKAYEKTGLISGENTGAMSEADLDRVFGPSGPLATGYVNYCQLSLAEWGVSGVPTMAQLGQRIKKYYPN
ncbi:MAG: twin-arginine translocation signal domain-containing protein [Rubrobacteraceae bacterium]